MKLRLRPITARYDAYLILTIAGVFVFAIILGSINHQPSGYFSYVGICGSIAILASTFILWTRNH